MAGLDESYFYVSVAERIDIRSMQYDYTDGDAYS